MMATIAVTIPSGRLKSLYTGIPIPGQRPLIVSTERLRLALAGVVIHDAAVIDTVKAQTSGEFGWRRNIGEAVRALEVVFTHGRRGKGTGRGRVVLYDIAYSKDAGAHKLKQAMITRDIHEWAESHRVRKSKQAIGGGNGSARAQRAGMAIRRMEKERSKLYLHCPASPLVCKGYEWDRTEHYQSWRDREGRWHDEKYHRKQLAKVAGKVLRSKITGTTAYKLIRDMGYTVRKFSELGTYDRDRRPEAKDYWKHLPEFCCLMGSANREKEYGAGMDDEGRNQYQRHYAALIEYLGNRREAESLDIQIAELRRLALEEEQAPVLKGGSVMTRHSR